MLTFPDPKSDPLIADAWRNFWEKKSELDAVNAELTAIAEAPVKAGVTVGGQSEVVGIDELTAHHRENMLPAGVDAEKFEAHEDKAKRAKRLTELHPRRRQLIRILEMQTQVIAKLTTDFSRGACEELRPKLSELVTDAAGKLKLALAACDQLNAFYDGLVEKGIVLCLPDVRPLLGTFSAKFETSGQAVGTVGLYVQELEKSGLVDGMPRAVIAPPAPPAQADADEKPLRKRRWLVSRPA
jgi:hypothetical protein